jgi:hypothetical protein
MLLKFYCVYMQIGEKFYTTMKRKLLYTVLQLSVIVLARLFETLSVIALQLFSLQRCSSKK